MKEKKRCPLYSREKLHLSPYESLKIDVRYEAKFYIFIFNIKPQDYNAKMLFEIYSNSS